MGPPAVVIVTDLDGTLLDQDTYRCDAAVSTIRKAMVFGVPLIFCSSKTRAEMETLRDSLGVGDPFIVENGGAVYWPRGYFGFLVAQARNRDGYEVVELGRNVTGLRRALEEAVSECDVQVKAFQSMDLDEIASLTGLTRDSAMLATEREYDEPFFVERGDPEKLFRTLRAKGFVVIRGDRFWHLTGGHGKGEAVDLLRALYERQRGPILLVGLGNSPNDLSLLQRVDRPVLVRNADGSLDETIMQEGMQNLRVSSISGSAGWSEAVERILAESN